jgi:thymidylate synthase
MRMEYYISELNFYDAWKGLSRAVMIHGLKSAPRSKPVIELLATQFTVTDLQNNILVHPLRDLNYRFMVAEWLWIEAGRNDVKTVEEYNKQIAQFSDDGEIFNGAYGPRMGSQWLWLIDLIKRDRDTRQGIVSIWTPAPKNSKDIPCTLSLQVLLRGGKLHGVVTMRSQDLWLGLPYDFFNFSQIVNGLAGELDVECGSLTFNVGSSHVYANNFSKMQDVLESPSLGYHVRSPRLPRRPSASMILDMKDVLSPEDQLYQNVLRCGTKKLALSLLREGI